MKQLNFLLIGCGPHARRIYYPVFERLESEYRAKITCIVDLKEKMGEINTFLDQKEYTGTRLFLALDNKTCDTLPATISEKLNRIAADQKISAVIIATEPTAHRAYASWALRQGLNVLMDKPISTQPDAAINSMQAAKIAQDYYDLSNELQRGREKNPLLVFNIMAQRRYHPAFRLMRHLISEVSDRTNCPVTSVQSFHGDGQWRTPSELIDIDYHSYNQGYGKCSHSGYHTIDMASWLINSANVTKDKKRDKIEVFANFVRPVDYLAQITPDDYRRLFPDYDTYPQYEDQSLKERVEDFGEVDATVSLTYKNNGRIITVGTLNMMHNSFSQRYLPHSHGRDLYKGNGRVRHESHYICQGPFQSISYISYQGKEIDGSVENVYGVGGESHAEIHVFRNNKLFPEWQNYTHYSIENLTSPVLEGYSRGHQEDARLQCIIEFIYQLRGLSTGSASSFEDHRESVEIMSAIYQSAIVRKQRGHHPYMPKGQHYEERVTH